MYFTNSVYAFVVVCVRTLPEKDISNAWLSSVYL